MNKNLKASLGAVALLFVMAVSSYAVNIIPLKPDSANAAPCTVFGSPSNGMSCGKTTAPSGKLDIVGNLNVTGAIVSGSGVTAGTDALYVSSSIIGSMPTVSTFSANGNADIGGALTVAGALTPTGGIVGPLTINSGAFLPYHRSSAQINALTGAVGRVYSCSDCTNTYTLCVATGTAANQYREVGAATGCK